jgi:hypothetical protein
MGEAFKYQSSWKTEDWMNTFIQGSGTVNYIPKWSDTRTLTDSIISDNGSIVDINGELDVNTYGKFGTMYIHWTRGIYSVSVTNNKVFPYYQSPITYLSGDLSDGSAVAHLFDTSATLAAAGDKLFSFRNATAEKASMDKDGVLTAPNYISNVATGTAPYACTSTTLNTNLNADQVDSLNAQTLTATSPITLSGTTSVLAAAGITIAHDTTAGNKHIPTAGAAGQLLINSAGTSGTAKWATVTEDRGALGAVTSIAFPTAAASMIDAYADNKSIGISQTLYSDTAGHANQITWNRAGGTAASPDYCPANANVGGFFAACWMGTGFDKRAQVKVTTPSAHGSGDQPTQWEFMTTADGTGTMTAKLTIGHTDTIQIGAGQAGIDFILKFDGETNDGLLTWMEDEDYFKFDDDIMLLGGENIILDTSTGTKIGTATSQLLGFYNATPVNQPDTVADPSGGGTQDAEARTAINAIIDRLQELGLIA